MNNQWAPIDHYSDAWLLREVRNNTLRAGAASRELARRGKTPTPSIGQALDYIGPKPERDVPRWMTSPVSFRRVEADDIWEVFTTDGSRSVKKSNLRVRASA